MKYFHSIGGNNNPYFRYRVKVPKCTNDMFRWCENFDCESQDFRRWHVEWKKFSNNDYDVVQFEWDKAALMFKLTWGGE